MISYKKSLFILCTAQSAEYIGEYKNYGFDNISKL